MSEHLTLTVTGMTCGGCENAVKRAVSRLDGIVNVTASHGDQRVDVEFDPAKANRTAIAERIAAAGYTVAPPM
jgi:copper chaperone CopZ